MTTSERTTLREAKEWLRPRVSKGARCPCCHQFAKVYERALTRAMALALVLIYQYFEASAGWLDINAYLLERKFHAANSNAARLHYWGLIEKNRDVRRDGSSRNGLYQITELGRSFVRGEVRIPKYIRLYDQKLLVSKNPLTISLQEALGVSFSYEELMKEVARGSESFVEFEQKARRKKRRESNQVRDSLAA